MTDSYDAVAYLLDRANIHDTITKMGACVDGGSWASVPDEVFAADLRIDYTELFPGEPYVTTGAKQVAEWGGLLKILDKSQHVLSGILVDLPQPGSSVKPPTVMTATANVIVSHRRDAAPGGPIAQNGGSYKFELTKVPSGTGNPWRISAIKAHVSWTTGNAEVIPRTGQ